MLFEQWFQLLYCRFSFSAAIILFLLLVSLALLLELEEDGVDEELFEEEDELFFDDVPRIRLKMQRIALESPSPIADR